MEPELFPGESALVHRLQQPLEDCDRLVLAAGQDVDPGEIVGQGGPHPIIGGRIRVITPYCATIDAMMIVDQQCRGGDPSSNCLAQAKTSACSRLTVCTINHPTR